MELLEESWHESWTRRLFSKQLHQLQWVRQHTQPVTVLVGIHHTIHKHSTHQCHVYIFHIEQSSHSLKIKMQEALEFFSNFFLQVMYLYLYKVLMVTGEYTAQGSYIPRDDRGVTTTTVYCTAHYMRTNIPCLSCLYWDDKVTHRPHLSPGEMPEPIFTQFCGTLNPGGSTPNSTGHKHFVSSIVAGKIVI